MWPNGLTTRPVWSGLTLRSARYCSSGANSSRRLRTFGVASRCLVRTCNCRIGRVPIPALQADAQLAIGKPEAVLASVAAGLKAGGAPLEAELYRLRGEALLGGAGTVCEAEAAMQQGIDVARRQNAKSWELRGATNLARLRHQQGRRAEAVALLAPILGWFTEGFDTADLKEAKTLLDKLTESAIAEG